MIGSRPRLLLAQALLALVSGSAEAVEASLDAAGRALDAAERALAGPAGGLDEPYKPSVGKGASIFANVPAAIALDRAFLVGLRGDADGAMVFLHQALAEIGEGEWLLDSLTRENLGMAEWLRGRLSEAERVLGSSMATWQAAGERSLALSACEPLGYVRRAQGRLDAALRAYEQGLEVAAAVDGPAVPAAGGLHVGIAAVAYQRNELDAALRHATEGIALSRGLAYPQQLATGLAILAWIRHAQGDSAGARDAMAEAAEVALGPAVNNLLNPVPVLWARLLLAQGEVAAAVRWTKERELDADDDVAYPREGEYLLLARVLLAEQAPQRAISLLGRLHALAVAQGRTGSLIEIQALQALALHAAGEEPGALAALAQALTLAAPEDYLRVFVDEGTPMAALLGRLLTGGQARIGAAGGVPPDYLARLVEAFEQAGQVGAARPRRGGVLPGLVVPLTTRELEVLQLLAAGKSNPAIAQELVITLDTVKRHVTHILDKLGAANRTQAVIRAQELGLLP